MRARTTPAFLALLAAALFAGGASAGDSGARVLYYGQSDNFFGRKIFAWRVLKLVLSKSGKPYQLRPSPIGQTSDSRARDALIAGEKVDIAWLATSAAADRELSPVRVPVDRGLLGYRIFLIDARRQDAFAKVRTLADLSRLRALQGHGWSDTEVLRHAGLEVRSGEYTHLFRMTIAGRGDYFPRSAFEAFVERDQHTSDAPGLAIEQTLALHYPLAIMFYVRKSDTALRDDLQRGFERAYADGSYMRLFLSSPEIRTALDEAKLKSRRIFEIENPFFPAEDRAIDAKYWYRP